MTDMNGFHYTDNVDDVLAVYINRLMDSTLRSEYKNVETLDADRELTDADAPIQCLDCDGTDRVVTMPLEEAVNNHPFVLVNASTSAGTITVKNHAGTTTLNILAPGEMCLMLAKGDGTYQPLISDAPANAMRYVRKDHAWEALPADGVYPAFVRCSVVSNDPNPISSLAGQTAVYAFPWQGDTYPQWNGSDFTARIFTAQTLMLSAAHLSGSVYDIYLWLDGETQRIVTGPAWSSGTSRGTGAGTAETEVINGVMVNKVELTGRNGETTYTMPARGGTVIATICPSANGQVDWTAANRGVFNHYSRMAAPFYTCPGYVDNAANTSYTNSTTVFAEANGGVGSRVKFVLGAPTAISFYSCAVISAASTGRTILALGLDTTTNPAGFERSAASAALVKMAFTENNKGLPVGIGSHYVAMLFAYQTAGPSTIYADLGGTRMGASQDPAQTYMSGEVLM